MNIFKHEFNMKKKSIIIWSLSLSAFMIFYMAFFPAIAKDSASFESIMNSFPEEMLQALGIKEGLSLASLMGFFTLTFAMMQLAIAIQSANYGFSILSEEERELTAEYLFALPISRRKVIVSKTISAIINLFILNIITLSSMILSTMSYDKEENFYRFIGIIFVSIFIIQMIFLSIGMFVSSVNKRHKKSGNISVGILMITFLISSLINMVDTVDFLKYITAFKYFETAYILNEMSLEPIYIVLSILIIVAGIGGTFVFYPKRDLYI